MFWKTFAYAIIHPFLTLDFLLNYGWRQGWERIKLQITGYEEPFRARPADESAPLFTPLHRVWYEDQVRELIQVEADVNVRDREGRTPLHFVSDINIAVRLIEAGADVNARDNLGNTPLHRVVVPEIVDLLEGYGANLNARNSEGETPLFAAVCKEKFEIARRLMRLYAVLEIPNRLGETPIVAAFRLGYKQMFDLLKDGGANLIDAIRGRELPAPEERKMEYKAPARREEVEDYRPEVRRRPKRHLAVIKQPQENKSDHKASVEEQINPSPIVPIYSQVSSPKVVPVSAAPMPSPSPLPAAPKP